MSASSQEILVSDISELRQALGYTDELMARAGIDFSAQSDQRSVAREAQGIAKHLAKQDTLSLIGVYFNASTSQLLGTRNYSNYPALRNIYGLASASFQSPVQGHKEQVENTIRFVAAVLAVDQNVRGHTSKEKTFRESLQKFLINFFRVDVHQVKKSRESQDVKTRDIAYHIINRLLASEPAVTWQILNMEGVTPISGFKDFAKQLGSRAINEKKERSSQFTTHGNIGQIPSWTGVDQQQAKVALIDSIQPRWVFSCVERDEFITTNKTTEKLASEIMIPAHLILRNIQHVSVPGFIDYGRLYEANPDFAKNKNPMTGRPFTSQQEWHDHLHQVIYPNIFYAAKLMRRCEDAGENYYVHCKAGKGRSLMLVITFLMYNPDKIPADQQTDLMSRCAADPAQLAAVMADDRQLRQLLDEVWEYVLNCRDFVDHDEKSKLAALDLIHYVERTPAVKSKSVAEIDAHFLQLGRQADMHSAPAITATSSYSQMIGGELGGGGGAAATTTTTPPDVDQRAYSTPLNTPERGTTPRTGNEPDSTPGAPNFIGQQ